MRFNQTKTKTGRLKAPKEKEEIIMDWEKVYSGRSHTTYEKFIESTGALWIKHVSICGTITIKRFPSITYEENYNLGDNNGSRAFCWVIDGKIIKKGKVSEVMGYGWNEYIDDEM